MVFLESDNDALGLGFDFGGDRDDISSGLLVEDLDFLLDIDVDWDLGLGNLVVTVVSEASNCEFNPDVDLLSGGVDLALGLVVDFGGGLDDPGFDSDGGFVDFSLTVGFKIGNDRSPVVDDAGFFSGVEWSPLDGELMDVNLGLLLDFEGEYSNSVSGFILESLDGNFSGLGDGDGNTGNLNSAPLL